MSANTAKTNVTKDEKAAEEKTVPAQTTGEASDAKSAAVLTIGDALKAVEEKKSEGLTVTLTLDEDGQIQVQVDEVSEGGKAKKLVSGVKGIYQRNKKLVVATGALVATSVLLKVLANRSTELEADEVVESSDDVSVDA